MERICMYKRILVTGAAGQVGKALVQRHASLQGAAFFFTDKANLDITDADAVDTFVSENAIDMIVNCAAYTAVDKAEEERESAFAVNRDAVSYLAAAAKKYTAAMIHISTDYVFDGMAHRPLRETDRVNPQGIYGISKREGEEAIMQIAPEPAAIIRTSWVYDEQGHNFVNTILRLGKERETLSVVSDQIGTPTYAGDLAETILEMIKRPDMAEDGVEIYHYSNEGVCSWYDFAHAVFELSGIGCKVLPIPTEAYPTPAKRPAYSVLDKRKIKERYDIEVPHWRDSLKRSLKMRGA